jgi:hypothetical protein
MDTVRQVSVDLKARLDRITERWWQETQLRDLWVDYLLFHLPDDVLKVVAESWARGKCPSDETIKNRLRRAWEKVHGQEKGSSRRGRGSRSAQSQSDRAETD